MKPQFAVLITLCLTTPAWAEEDLPMPTHWGGTGSEVQIDEETSTVTFGDSAHGARLPAQADEPAEDDTALKPEGTPVRSKVQVRGWDVEKKKPLLP